MKYNWKTYNNEPPVKQCVECKRQYTKTGSMVLNPANKATLRKMGLKLVGIYDGCLFP